MGKEFDKVLNVLDKIEKVLSIVESITPFPPHSLDAYRLCAQSIRLQLSTQTEEGQWQDVKSKLAKLKSLIKHTIVSHVDNITAPVHITWNQSAANTPLSLTELHKLTEILANQITAYNRATTRSLNILRRKIADNAPQELLAEFDTMLKKLEQSPASPVSPETIKYLKSKAQGYKNKPRILAAAIMEEEKPKSPFLKTLDALRGELDKLLDAHSQWANQAFAPGFAEDFLLSGWVNDYKAKTADADIARLFITGRIQNTLEFPDYHEILINELQRTIALLKEANGQRQQLAEKILAREALIYPADHDEGTLEQFMLTAKTMLKKQFETCLLTFCVIDVNNKDDKDTQFFIKNLLKFIGDLKQRFQKYPGVVNSSAIDSLHNQLLMHLGEKKRFLIWSTSLSKMEAKDITALSNQLFDVASPSKVDTSYYRKRIAGSYDLAAFIDAFPIQAIKDYQILKEINEDEHLKILSKEKQIVSDIDALTQELSEYFLLLPEVLGENGPWKAARGLLGELETFRVDEQAGLYIQAREKALEVVSPLDRVHQLASLQKKRLDQIADRAQKLNTFHETASPLIKTLKQEFENKKKDLEHQLIAELADAEAALSFIQSSSELSFTGDSKKEFETAVELAKQLIKTVPESKEHLFKLRRQVSTAVDDLRLKTEAVKGQLKRHITPCFNNAKRFYEEHPCPLLDEDNPLKFRLNQAWKDTMNALRTLDKSFADLDKLQGRDFKGWSNQWAIGEKQFVTAFERYLKVTADAMEIERRLKTETYKTSCTILTKLEMEFERLTQKYIDQAIHKTSDKNEIEQLQQLKTLSKTTFVECKKDVLDRVDPRLHTLAAMHTEFSEINTTYIHENVHLSDDKTFFTHLKASADKHFRNNNMEKLSDGIRNKWVQYLRINVFKPLQALSFNVGNYLKSRSQDLFFVTFGACRTEKELAELGHDLSSRLVAPAA